MNAHSSPTSTPWSALLGGFAAVALFSLTMPLMRLAVVELDPVVVGVGRILISAVPAAITLAFLGVPRLSASQLGRLALVTLCLVFGFAGLTAVALRTVTSHHAAIVTGGIPLATALFATLRGDRRPTGRFWAAAICGSALVVGYGLARSGGHLSTADLYLLAAALVCGLGYSEGSRLSTELGSTTLACLMPLVAAPFALWLCWHRFPADWSTVHSTAWLAWLYNGLISAFGAFFLWYPALKKGGVARVGQVQLLQPFLTLASASLLVGEALSWGDWLVATAVVGCVALAQNSPQRRPAQAARPDTSRVAVAFAQKPAA